MSDLLKIDVSAHTEKKGNLTYLSWAWAWAEVLKIDPSATWEVVEFNGLPVAVLPDSTAMVKVVVTINSHAKSCWLPVMDNRNKAIAGPDAFAINTAHMRCMVKTVALFGLGLYIYAGEDVPEGDEKKEEKKEEKKVEPKGMPATQIADWLSAISAASDDELPGIVKAAQDAAQLLEDRMAWVSFRDAGKSRKSK